MTLTPFNLPCPPVSAEMSNAGQVPTGMPCDPRYPLPKRDGSEDPNRRSRFPVTHRMRRVSQRTRADGPAYGWWTHPWYSRTSREVGRRLAGGSARKQATTCVRLHRQAREGCQRALSAHIHSKGPHTSFVAAGAAAVAALTASSWAACLSFFFVGVGSDPNTMDEEKAWLPVFFGAAMATECELGSGGKEDAGRYQVDLLDNLGEPLRTQCRG